MSIIDDKTSIIFDPIGKIGSDFQKISKTKFRSMKILAKSTVLIIFYEFHFFFPRGSRFYSLDWNRVKRMIVNNIFIIQVSSQEGFITPLQGCPLVVL